MGSNLLEALTRPFHNFTDEDAIVFAEVQGSKFLDEPSGKAERKVQGEKQVYIMRPCMIHGPGNKGNLNLLYGVVSKGIPWPLGAFEIRRSFTSIGNLQEVIKGLLTKDAPSGIYHMGDDEALSTNELIEVICSENGVSYDAIKLSPQRTDRGDMQCPGQESAYLATAQGVDVLCGSVGRVAAFAPGPA